MPTVFPYLGSIGYTAKHAYQEVVNDYPGGLRRRWLRSSHNEQVVTINLDNFSQTKKETVVTFLNTAKQSTDDTFFFYNPEETSTVDPTGVATTGRHTAALDESEFEVTRAGNCMWNLSIPIRLLD